MLKFFRKIRQKLLNEGIGDYTGIITLNDTIDVWVYKHKKNNSEKGIIRWNGMWKLNSVNYQNRTLSLKPQYKNGSIRNFNFDEIQFMYFPKIVKAAPNPYILWFGAIIPGTSALTDAIVSGGKEWKRFLIPAIISTVSFSYIFGWGKKE